MLRKRTTCPAPTPRSDFGKGTGRRGNGLSSHSSYCEEEEQYEENKRVLGFPAGGYLIGRHPECGTQPYFSCLLSGILVLRLFRSST